ncbi:hypothetical protein [Epibacterium ulvae]|uniref:hypothetical protein n=1 Tax=Epibacterium ulvae TaxID=1156985 RepID=UPI002490D97A|nr:hypothetical protein [Epibacterium ulvae]
MSYLSQSETTKRLQSGETLITTFTRGHAVTHASGGGTVKPDFFTRLKADGMLTPISAGLLPDSDPQEWGWADG